MSQLNSREEWLLERRKYIGSSDVPAIIGVSPWRSPRMVWQEKLGLIPSFSGNFATERGNRLEPAARACYEILNDIEMAPLKVFHRDYPFLQAALDGANLEAKRLLEIKCPGKVDHDTALGGLMPEKYRPQVQFQLLVSGFEEAHYYSYLKGAGALVRVHPDLNYFAFLLKELLIFWNYVQTETPPPLNVLDHKNEAKAARKAKKNAVL